MMSPAIGFGVIDVNKMINTMGSTAGNKAWQNQNFLVRKHQYRQCHAGSFA
jgi:hypothetical protein